MVKKLTNITARIENNVKKVDEKYSYDYFHKFTPIQLYNYLYPVCSIDALRFLQMIIKRAQSGHNILTMKMFKRRYGRRASIKVMKSLVNEGLIIEAVPGVYSCTEQVNKYSFILGMLRLEDDAPDVIDTEDCNKYRIVYEPGMVYRVISRKGKVFGTFIDKKEAEECFEDIIIPKDKRNNLDKVSDTDEKQLTI